MRCHWSWPVVLTPSRKSPLGWNMLRAFVLVVSTNGSSSLVHQPYFRSVRKEHPMTLYFPLPLHPFFHCLPPRRYRLPYSPHVFLPTHAISYRFTLSPKYLSTDFCSLFFSFLPSLFPNIFPHPFPTLRSRGRPRDFLILSPFLPVHNFSISLLRRRKTFKIFYGKHKVKWQYVGIASPLFPSRMSWVF